MKTIVIIHGPNLSRLRERQPEIYGDRTLEQINHEIESSARGLGLATSFHQADSEGKIIELIHGCNAEVVGIVLNPAGYAHTSVAILDALLAAKMPAVEVHLTNVYKREEFRQTMITARGAVGVISGFGVWSYLLAVQYLASLSEHK
jgi:3-dehydroquinate dehydratase-2